MMVDCIQKTLLDAPNYNVPGPRIMVGFLLIRIYSTLLQLEFIRQTVYPYWRPADQTVSYRVMICATLSYCWSIVLPSDHVGDPVYYCACACVLVNQISLWCCVTYSSCHVELDYICMFVSFWIQLRCTIIDEKLQIRPNGKFICLSVHSSKEQDMSSSIRTMLESRIS
jgi:hypothetical protein